MHHDELRDSNEIKHLRVRNIQRDPKAVVTEITYLQEQVRQNRKIIEQANYPDLKQRLSEASTALAEVRMQLRDVTAEKVQLQRKLTSLRQSRSYRVGYQLGQPVRFVRKYLGRGSLGFLGNSKLQHNSFGSGSSEQKMLQASNSTASKPDSFGEKASNKELKEFETELKRLWFQEGSINKSFSLVQSTDSKNFHNESLSKLIEQVKGEFRLLQRGITLPPTGGNASFIQEPGRIMYCVHSSPVFNSNGYSTRTRGVASGIENDDYGVVVVSRSGYPWDTSIDVKKPAQKRIEKNLDGVRYIHNPGPGLGDIAMDHYFMVAADAFVREAKRLRPEIIQAASNHRTALPALIAARRVGVPFVYEVRGLWELSEAAKKPGFAESERFKLMKDLETVVCRNADKVLAITSQVAEELVERGVDPNKIEIVPNGVDPSRFLPYPKDEHFAKSRKVSIDVPVIGFAGSLVEYEGLDLLVRASAKLSERGVKHQIAIAGSGASEAGLKKLAKSLPKSNVIFLGRLPQNQIPRLLSTFDIVACPRKSHLVTELVSPLKPLESFSAGKATLLSDVAPNVDLAGQDSGRAELFEKDSVDSLVESLERLLGDGDRRLKLGRTARQWVSDTRSWEAIGEIFRGVYSQLENSARSDSKIELKKPLKVGVIADEFTRTTIAESFELTMLEPDNWREQLLETRLDMIFVESAWEGNEGLWHRAVGYYSDEESRSLYELLEEASEVGIPTVFWNKEDPVHFERFANTASKCKHVFTTDANLIERYLQLPNNRIESVSSLPFFSQPELHNPLVSQEKKDAFAFAGTYYGQRYATRTKSLDILLSAAKKYGLEIFDRQASNPESPYQFPEELRQHVKGSLPYADVVRSYTENIAHLNVSSVDNSPTMYSRRVAEIPACGGIVLSTPSRGIAESLGNNIATSDDLEVLDTWMDAWKNDPAIRNNEVWRQMRTIFRSHTADTELSILARTIGIGNYGLALPSYEVSVEELTEETAFEILKQSVRPTYVATDSIISGQQILNQHGIGVINQDQLGRAEYCGNWVEEAPRTFYEDLLLPTRFGDWVSIVGFSGKTLENRISAVFPLNEDETSENLIEIGRLVSKSKQFGDSVGVLLAQTELKDSIDHVENFEDDNTTPDAKSTVLIAGHDLKFAKGLIESLESEGHNVLIDKWDAHAKHDEAKSIELLSQADVVFCEWGLGNAVWYSKHVKKNQRLVVRVHLQEIQLPYLKKIDNRNVDKFVFVGELIRRTAILSHGVKGDKSIVIPNGVDVAKLDLPKEGGSEFNIGFVGMIPQRKRLDLAISLIEELLKVDDRYSLMIRGKQPADYPWMKDRPDEMKYYNEQFERIAEINRKHPGAIQLFEFGDDMAEWYQKIGFVISTSDYESFHFTIADGAASGAVPVSLSWPGADLIYPDEWLYPDVAAMAEAILNRKVDGRAASEFIRHEFNMPSVNIALQNVIVVNDRTT